MFETLIAAIDYDITRRIFKVQVQLSPDQLQAVKQQQQTNISAQAQISRSRQQTVRPVSALGTDQPANKKPGRNDPCPCGSGKKYKKCHYPDYG